MNIPVLIKLSFEDDRVKAALESIQDGTGITIEPISDQVVAHTETGSLHFVKVKYYNGNIYIEGSMSYICPGHVMALCFSRAETEEEVREVAKYCKEHLIVGYVPNVDEMAQYFIDELTTE